ncbi:hypothetical protein PS850_04928 [Pseudomonas fluorescens]|nr:hypothetical protein PS850_04928 [Pseudomonas fluorescens]
MNILNNLITAVRSALSQPAAVYTTVIYPTRGQAVIVHDDLGVAAERSWYEDARVMSTASLLNTAAFYTVEDDLMNSESIAMADCAGDSMGIGLYSINPATGLPMIDGLIDVMGNLMGMDAHAFDGPSFDFSNFSSSTFSDMDICGSNGCFPFSADSDF